MQLNNELESQPDSAPPPPGNSRVEITIGGHTITVESPDPLADVVGYALGLYEQTKDAARRIPFGFNNAGGQFERAEPYVDPAQQGGEDRAREVEGQQAALAATRRLVLDDPAGRHRARWGPVPMDRGRAAVPRPRN